MYIIKNNLHIYIIAVALSLFYDSIKITKLNAFLKLPLIAHVILPYLKHKRDRNVTFCHLLYILKEMQDVDLD